MRNFFLHRALSGSVLAVTLAGTQVSAQSINVDMSNNTDLIIRAAEMEASLKIIEESSAKENRESKTEYEQSVKVFEQTLYKFYDCAPGMSSRMTEWAAIRGGIEVAGKTMFKDGNDSIYKNLCKKINKRMFTLPDAADMPGDVIWRRYKDAFIRAEKAFLGTSQLAGIEDIVNTVAGATEGEIASIMGSVDKLGGGKDVKGILSEGVLSDEKLDKAFREEVLRIIEDVKVMHSSWIPSADKETYYQKKLQELNKLYAHVRGADWVDFILESEKTDRMNINEEYRKILDGGKKSGGRGGK